MSGMILISAITSVVIICLIVSTVLKNKAIDTENAQRLYDLTDVGRFNKMMQPPVFSSYREERAANKIVQMEEWDAAFEGRPVRNFQLEAALRAVI